MLRLKSRDVFPPGEFQVLHPEAGMATPFQGSFREAVAFEMAFRQKNQALCQRLGLPVDVRAAELYVDNYNAQRCLSAGWDKYIVLEEGATTGFVADLEKKSLLGRLVVAGQRGRTALTAYFAMFGKTGPVDRAKAELRAQICEHCPQNDTEGGVAAHFTEAAAAEIMSVLSALKDLDLTTSVNDELGVCKACYCPMKAKVFAPLDAMTAKMPAEDWDKLNKERPKCWILQESGR